MLLLYHQTVPILLPLSQVNQCLPHQQLFPVFQDEAKNYCATTDPAQLAATNDHVEPVATNDTIHAAASNDTPKPDVAADVVGTQHSEVGSTQMGIKRHKGPTN
ncbi:amino acid ABC transporter substrate-binding protein [Sesbania bispinosa]|nr:amino acid ABC transporter substrate-binding protein [Sesbania bispinosa]